MKTKEDRNAWRQLCLAASARQLNEMLRDVTTNELPHNDVRIAIIETVADQFAITLTEPPPACCGKSFTARTVTRAEGLIFVTTWCNRDVDHDGRHALEDGRLE